MRRRRALVVGSVAFGTLCAIAAACTFPDVAFAPGGASGEAGADGTTEGADADAGTDGSLAPPPIDATSEKPDSGACTNPCDCDNDTFLARDAGCGGNDCDDRDNRANPNANFTKDLATEDTKGDWNCDKVVERSIKNVNVTCNGSVGDTCPGGREGLQADIPCGTFGTYVVCAPGPTGLTCNQVDSGTAQQECR